MLRRICLVLVLIGSTAYAGPGQAKRDEIKSKIRALRIARVVEILDLDEQGAAHLAPLMNHAYDEIATISQDSGEARRELRILILAKVPDNGKINVLIDRLLANKAKIETVESRMFGEVRRILQPSQVARLVVVLPEINHQIQQQIRGALGEPQP